VFTVYFKTLAGSGQAHAMVVSLVVVGTVTVLCCGLVWLLPTAARAEPSGEAAPGDAAAEAGLPGLSSSQACANAPGWANDRRGGRVPAVVPAREEWPLDRAAKGVRKA